MARVTPPLRVKGVFRLRSPFIADPGVAYTVQAIRSFDEIRARNTDPMTLIYAPAGLSADDYARDVAEGAAIITLMSATQAPLYVPDTYIESYPDMGSVSYSWLVCSVSLGALPDSFDTTLLTQQMGSVVSDYIGVEAQVNIGKAPLLEVVSSEQHAQLVAARHGAITSRETDRARALKAEARVVELLNRVELLEQMVLDQEVSPQ